MSRSAPSQERRASCSSALRPCPSAPRSLNYGSNVLKFGAGVDPSKMTASRNDRDLLLTLSETGETIAVKDWYRRERNRLAEIRFADGTVWSTQDVEDIASGAKPAFAAPLDAEIGESLSILSAPSFASMLRGGLDEGSGECFGGWDRDPSLAAIMNGTLDAESDAANFEVARLGMDVALAGLSFETPNSGLVCDTLLSGFSDVEAVKLSVASEASLDKHFEDGARYDELPRSAA